MPWTSPSPPKPSSEFIVASIVAATLALLSWGVTLASSAGEPPSATAQAIASGARQSRALGDDDASDADLADDLEAAGNRWAEHHPSIQAAECPRYSPEFLKGCKAGLSGARQPPSP